MIRIGRKECVNTERATRKEWLDTNGIGGYASSTVINCHTRKYHGLLVAALKKPKGRFVLLSKVETSLLHDDLEFALSTNKYPGVYHPTGHQFFDGFEQGLHPSVTYRIGDMLLRKSILMVYGENTVLLSYELLEGRVSPTLRIRPMLAYRDVHRLTQENMFLRPRTYPEKNGRKIQPYDGMPPLYMGTNRSSEFYAGPKWHLNVEYLQERERGFKYQEDLFCPGVFDVPLKKGKPVIFAASTDPISNLERVRKKEVERREQEFSRSRTVASTPAGSSIIPTSSSSVTPRTRLRSSPGITGSESGGVTP
ncbi:glycogen debranching enzyme N-terminal domain-containing protein [Salidesulfovibrio brasiliensis]|uniref:glycogen debranching enzyme N-terminal domain-containing protein n=1 Tax=Salidesulfovibrio brasiliensis TaxID=221711 RepID=UPI000A893785|nr:glycogen debranching enzyme N-terminal domain-containing protein [Salidesulfovibrio brasiliensis]